MFGARIFIGIIISFFLTNMFAEKCNEKTDLQENRLQRCAIPSGNSLLQNKTSVCSSQSDVHGCSGNTCCTQHQAYYCHPTHCCGHTCSHYRKRPCPKNCCRECRPSFLYENKKLLEHIENLTKMFSETVETNSKQFLLIQDLCKQFFEQVLLLKEMYTQVIEEKKLWTPSLDSISKAVKELQASSDSRTILFEALLNDMKRFQNMSAQEQTDLLQGICKICPECCIPQE